MTTATPPTDRLALLYRITQTLNSSLDLHEVLNRMMDEVIAAIRAERGFVMLRDVAPETAPPLAAQPLVFKVARGMDMQVIEEPSFQVSRGVVDEVARAGQPMLTSDAQADARLNLRQSVLSLGLRSILCVPLQVKGATIGVVYVDNRLQAGLFTPADLDLLNSIASSAAVAIENARLYQLAVEKGRLERELQMAREVQASLLPRQTPQLPGWEFAAHWQPAREVSGDFYDFIPLGADQLGLVIADVTDKGMPAALFMALSRSIVRASVTNAPSPLEGIVQANRLICADSTNSMFVTLCYAQIDALMGEVTFVNAGHNPPLLYRAGADQLGRLARTGMALGVEAESPFEQRVVSLARGDFILLYTDGVTDALNALGEEFGLERLRQAAQAHRQAPIAELMAEIKTQLADFIGDSAPFDDVTLVVARRV
jgi:sigma-B regulation protein RsbU (phosphoserine phosphatase)